MSVNLSTLKPARGSKHRRKILGRGEGSGHGQTSTRGMKGQRSRSGDGRRMGFEGGQMPLLRRIPKRGFNNAVFKKHYAIVNLNLLDKIFASGDQITPEELHNRGIIRDPGLRVKILGEGSLTKKLHVAVHAASRSAEQAITKAGGRFEAIRPS
ncbi:MAG: 50S ribosomal protein L15 [Elusimicrobia bacterium]|nr:50S ribosomal protein L15 [Elusimicrobiota bacterium]